MLFVRWSDDLEKRIDDRYKHVIAHLTDQEAYGYNKRIRIQ